MDILLCNKVEKNCEKDAVEYTGYGSRHIRHLLVTEVGHLDGSRNAGGLLVIKFDGRVNGGQFLLQTSPQHRRKWPF